MGCLKTFFVVNRFNRENQRELRLKGYHVPSRISSSEYVPTLREALTMADRAGNKRDRAIILTLITSGLRNSALRALRIGDILAELEDRKKSLLIKIEPSWNQRIPGACKNRIEYYTFTAGVATDAIESMLRERKNAFRPFSPEEPLFASNYNQIPVMQRRFKPLTAEALRAIVHNAARRTDIHNWKKVRVHSLRKVFDAVLRTPLADGTQMDHKDQEFLMGHTLRDSQEHYYDRTKVERLRELHSKLVFEDTSRLQDVGLEVNREVARALGVDVSETRAIKERQLGRLLTSQEEAVLLDQAIKASGKPLEEQKIVNIDELEQHLRSGWKYVDTLPDKRVVISNSHYKSEACQTG